MRLCLAIYTGMSATETAITIIIHKNVDEALPCQNIFIALPLPAPHILGPWCSFSSHRPRCVGHLCYPFIRLLPTCIPGKLYARERSEKREKKRDVSSLFFDSDLFSRSYSSRTHVHAYFRNALRVRSRTHLYFSGAKQKGYKNNINFHTELINKFIIYN